MDTWNDTIEYPETGLLPAGKQHLQVVYAARVTNEHTQREEGVLDLESNDGIIGRVSIPLEPWNDDREKFKRVFKTYAAGLGFEPNYPEQSVEDIAGGEEFVAFLHAIVGRRVLARIEHVPSNSLKDDGTPFINHRVRFRGLVSNGLTADQLQNTPLAALA